MKPARGVFFAKFEPPKEQMEHLSHATGLKPFEAVLVIGPIQNMKGTMACVKLDGQVIIGINAKWLRRTKTLEA